MKGRSAEAAELTELIEFCTKHRLTQQGCRNAKMRKILNEENRFGICRKAHEVARVSYQFRVLPERH